MGDAVRRAARRRLIVIPLLVLTMVMVLVMAITVVVAIFTAPAAAPVAVASTVLGTAADVFGGGEGDASSGSDLAAAANPSEVKCDLAPAPDPETPTPVPTTAETAAVAADSNSGEAPSTAAVRLGRGGSISRDDAAMLIAPLENGTSALKAHVWFLYRLAGIGDWESFNSAYTAAGLRDDEDSANAPLRQVQIFNTARADVGMFRLTAAALVAVGEQTGRFRDPYPRYRDLVAIELMSSCMSGTGTDEDRMTLPPPGPPESVRKAYGAGN